MTRCAILTVAALVFLVVGATAQTVTGSGTTNTVPVFTGSSTVGNSPITVSGNNVGVGTMNGVQIVGYGSNTTIQLAITAAGTTGAVVIPPSYTGTDSYTNPSGILIYDERPQSVAPPTQVRSVKEWGAKCNGTANDTAAIQAAVNSFTTQTFGIRFPTGGLCRITAPVQISSTTLVNLYGYGPGSGLLADYSAWSATPITTSGSASSGSTSLTVGSASVLYPNLIVTGAGIPANTIVVNVVGTAVTLSNPTTGTVSGMVSFTDYNAVEIIGTTGGYLVGQRLSDFSITGENNSSVMSTAISVHDPLNWTPGQDYGHYIVGLTLDNLTISQFDTAATISDAIESTFTNLHVNGVRQGLIQTGQDINDVFSNIYFANPSHFYTSNTAGLYLGVSFDQLTYPDGTARGPEGNILTHSIILQGYSDLYLGQILFPVITDNILDLASGNAVNWSNPNNAVFAHSCPKQHFV